MGGTGAPCSGESEREKSYNRIKIRLTIAGVILHLVVAAVWAFSGLSSAVVSRISRVLEGDYAVFFVFMALTAVVWSIILLPVDFYGEYLVEHRFGLSNQSLRAWLWEKAKGAAVSAVIGLPVIAAFYVFLRQTGWLWWIFFGAFLFVLSVIIARLAPVVIFPLFYTFTTLASEEVRDAIESILKKESISFSGIYSFNLGKDTNKASAGFMGIGRSRRIVLSDTLLADFTPQEIAVVFAHEIGHFRRRHILKGIALGTFIIFASLFVCNEIYRATIIPMGFDKVYDVAALPILFFYLAITGLVAAPLTNVVSRRHEREADRDALEITGDTASFISAMEKLAAKNLADRNPNPAIEFFFYSHPSIHKRIAFAREWAEAGSSRS